VAIVRPGRTGPAFFAHAHRHLSKANLHDLPPGVCRAEGKWRRFRGGRLYTDPIPKAKLKELLAQDETVSARAAADERTDLQNASDRPVRLDDAELIDLMVANPDLIQRPIVERGAHANLARSADRIRSFLTSAT
jgi:arsenate reductase